jgi:hypothetical protein
LLAKKFNGGYEMEKLSRLRIIFIVYIIIKIIIDLAFTKDIALGLSDYISAKMLDALIVVANLLLMVVGLILFYFLLEKKNWARIVLLVVGWLAVLDFFSGLLSYTHNIKPLENFNLGLDWNQLILIDRATDFVGFIFWGYAIYLLQITRNVKKNFLPEDKTNTLLKNDN